MQGIVQFASQNPAAAILLSVVIASAIGALVWAAMRLHWRELYTVAELVRNSSPVERKDATYGHRLVWQGPYYNVEFRLGNNHGVIAFHSDGHEKGWRVVGPLWWLQVDKDNPGGFYRRYRDKAPRPVPRVIRSIFDELVSTVRKRIPEFTPMT
ncbi:MAG: hypothetical protein AAB449_02285 [Patescibacteria group bacterium]